MADDPHYASWIHKDQPKRGDDGGGDGRGFVFILAAVAIGVVTLWFGSGFEPSNPPARQETPRVFNAVDALQICRGAFRVVLRDPEKAEIPWRAPRAGALGFMFVWEHGGGMRVRNGLGLDVPTTAVCWVMDDKSIRALKVGDHEFIIDGVVKQ